LGFELFILVDIACLLAFSRCSTVTLHLPSTGHYVNLQHDMALLAMGHACASHFAHIDQGFAISKIAVSFVAGALSPEDLGHGAERW
jgi:hypothetical protein